MNKNLIFVALITVLGISAGRCDAAKKLDGGIVSVKNFGATGDGQTDDAAALEKAMLFCVKNNKICLIPKTRKSYNIGTTIRVSLEPGEHLNILSYGAVIKPLAPPVNKSAFNLTAFKEHIFISVGKQITNYKSVETFKYSDGSGISVTGLIFDGSSFTGPFAPTSLTTNIFIGMQALADKVDVIGCTFRNIYGYGLNVYNVSNANLSHCKFEDVGGRGGTPFAQNIDRDAFGDGVHFTLVKTNGNISIQNCTFQGKKMQDKRSRSALTFEYSTQPYDISISNVKIAGFAKCVHIEETAPTKVTFDHVDMSDLNFGIANVLNDKTVISFNNCRIDVGLSDGNDAGDALAFLNYSSGAQITVDDSYLNFNGKRQAYQSAAGLVKVRNTTINGNNTNFFFADASIVFDNCNFIGFGGPAKSFFSNTGKGVYKVLNSTFTKGGAIQANGMKLQLIMEGNKTQ